MGQSIKRFGILMLLMALVVTAVSCGSGNSEDQAGSAEESTAEQQETTSDTEVAPGEGEGKALVVYFSRTGEQYKVGVIDKGNTAIVAEMIAEETGADMFEILPEEDSYPDTYDALTEVAKQEQNDNARPAYKGEVPDLSGYTTIFIGSPVWWGDWPMIMYTFFENEDLSGKKLVPFSTHEGSGLANFDTALAEACPDSEVLEGLAVRGQDAQSDQENVRSAVKDWLSGLGY